MTKCNVTETRTAKKVTEVLVINGVLVFGFGQHLLTLKLEKSKEGQCEGVIAMCMVYRTRV